MKMFMKQQIEMLTAVLTTIIPGVDPVLHVPKSPLGADLPSEASIFESFKPGGGDGGRGCGGSGEVGGGGGGGRGGSGGRVGGGGGGGGDNEWLRLPV